MGLIIGLLTSLPLGYVGEGGTRTIEIDVSEWLNRWPTAEIVVHVLRPDKYPYLPVTTVEDGVLKWTVQRDEVAVRGRGKAFISAINKVTGDEYKSRVVQTIIAGTIEEFESVEAGDPAKGWVQQVLDARDEAVDAARRAENAAGNGGGGTGVTVPSYWLTHLENRAADIREAMGKAGWDKSAFLFYSDAHWNYNYGSSPAILHWLDQHTNVNKVFFGGDVVQLESDDAVEMSYLWTWRTALHGLDHHSVPGNHDDGNSPADRWSEAYVYSFLLAAEETPEVVRGEGLYYYIDEPTEKTRYLFIDSASAHGAIAWNDTQKAWLNQTLISTPDGWHIVAIAHIWAEPDYSTTPPSAGELGANGIYMLDVFDQYNAREGDFADCTGRVEFCVGGHNHRDSDYTSADGIPVILVETDSRNVRSGLNCKSGTITENSVNAIIADYLNGTVSVIRIGRGNSRVVMLDGSGSEELPDNGEDVWEDYDMVAPTGNFDNVLDTATERGGASVYNNGNGYKNDTRYSSSGDEFVECIGWDISGFFPINTGDVLRFLNVEYIDMNDTGGEYKRNRIAFWDQNYNYLNASEIITLDNKNSDGALALNPVYGENGDVIQLTIPASYGDAAAYATVTAKNLTGASVITVNQVIDAEAEEEPDYNLTAPTGNFTNVIKISTEADLSTIYNDGHGYKNDTRFSSSSMSDVEANGWDITGYFPAKQGDVIRMKNVEFMDINDTGGEHKRNALWWYNEDLSHATQSAAELDDTFSPVFGENGDVVQFTIPNWGSTYVKFRICAKNITGASIITVNEEIDV